MVTSSPALSARIVPSPTGRNARHRLELLRDKAILQTLYATALPRQEILRLNRTDIQDGRAREGLVTGKGDKERTVFFDDESLAAIRAYLEARADAHLPQFIRHDDGCGKPGLRRERWRLSPQSVWLVVKKHGALAGVEVTTHRLRHPKARVLLNAGPGRRAIKGTGSYRRGQAPTWIGGLMSCWEPSPRSLACLYRTCDLVFPVWLLRPGGVQRRRSLSGRACRRMRGDGEATPKQPAPRCRSERTA
jgi:hypothetical protein